MIDSQLNVWLTIERFYEDKDPLRSADEPIFTSVNSASMETTRKHGDRDIRFSPPQLHQAVDWSAR